MGEPVDKTKKGLITHITAILQSSTRFSLAKSVIAGGIIGALLWLQYPPSAATQPAPVYPTSDDLRAVYANAADVAEGKARRCLVRRLSRRERYQHHRGRTQPCWPAPGISLS